ncbi:hypothetical protein [Crocosphaera sp. XPORK-15E]|uniref:hypothetical protein n=1 Tax=Crocosphaera sp. XPORK-15E TaxID=3110247 RepID=UPI002B1FA831|nr:hypothetical protein [Crocosphaera sp. XPORK-15E]MEA5536802.1 hypothetical protein [Crocosphaera sp. XPORK-15E]
MYFYQQVDQFNYESIVDYLKARARQNGIDPDVTDDIVIVWDDCERDHDDEGSLSIFGKLYVSKELLKLV